MLEGGDESVAFSSETFVLLPSYHPRPYIMAAD